MKDNNETLDMIGEVQLKSLPETVREVEKHELKVRHSIQFHYEVLGDAETFKQKCLEEDQKYGIEMNKGKQRKRNMNRPNGHYTVHQNRK